MLWNKKHVGVAVNLILCIAILMSGAASQAIGGTLVAEVEFLKVTEPEFMEVTEVELLKVSEPEFLEVSKPAFLKVSEPEFLVPTVSSSGLTIWGGEQKSVEYLMCAPLKGFPTPEKCLFEGQ